MPQVVPAGAGANGGAAVRRLRQLPLLSLIGS
jgi:hypothetical protein